MNKEDNILESIQKEFYMCFTEPSKEERLIYALKMILQDLPAKRDWLNPDIEKMARDLVYKKSS